MLHPMAEHELCVWERNAQKIIIHFNDRGGLMYFFGLTGALFLYIYFFNFVF